MASTVREQAKRVKDAIVEEYCSRTIQSAAFFERSEKTLMAGVTGNLRYFKPHPLYFASGEGQK